MKIIDEDLCAECAHCCLLQPAAGRTWELPALCVRGWPFTARFWNIISACPAFEKKEPA